MIRSYGNPVAKSLLLQAAPEAIILLDESTKPKAVMGQRKLKNLKKIDPS